MGTTHLLEIILRAKDEASRGLSTLRKNINAFGGAVTDLRSLLAGWGVGYLVKDMVKAATDSREALYGLNQALQKTGRYTPELSEQLTKNASALQRVTNFEDDATIAATKLLTVYKAVGTEELPRAQRVMQDMAAFSGKDLNDVVLTLGKSTEGMTRGLKEYGVNLTAAQAQALGFAGILDVLESKVGGQAEAMRKALGPWAYFENSLGDVKEAAGDVVSAVLGPLAEGMADLFSDVSEKIGEFKQSSDFGPWATQMALTIVTVLEQVGRALAAYIQLWHGYLAGVGKIMTAYASVGESVNKIIPAVTAAKAREKEELLAWYKELKQAGELMSSTENDAIIKLGNTIDVISAKLRGMASKAGSYLGTAAPGKGGGSGNVPAVSGTVKKPGKEEKAVWNPDDQAMEYAKALADTNKWYTEMDQLKADIAKNDADRAQAKMDQEQLLTSYQEQRWQWEQQTAARRAALEQKQLAAQRDSADMMVSIFANAYELSGQKMKAFYYAAKLAAIAQVIINTQIAASQVTAQTGLLGIPLLPLIYANGAMQVAMITAQAVQGYARGGKVRGSSSSATADDIPIRATAGEWVHPLDSVRYYGEGVMEGMRRRVIPRELFAGLDLNLPRRAPSQALAMGGVVGSGSNNGIDNGGGGVTVVNVLDASSMADVINSAEGQDAVLNVISRRSPAILRLLGLNR